MEPARSLRPATLEDLPAVLEIERKAHLAPWGEENFKGELEKPYCQFWVLTDDETDEQIAGYIVFWVMFDEAQILNVVVDLPYRGLGYAQNMISRAIQVATKKEAKRLTLEVRKGNLPAIQLYQKMGFTIQQIRKQFYSNGDDAYFMVLSLTGDDIQF